MEIYIAKSGQETGPFSEAQIDSMLNSGMISLTEGAWHEGLADWQPLYEVLNVSPPPVQSAQPPPIVAMIRNAAPVTQSASAASTIFLYIPTQRLIAMSIVSFGIYDAYWIYRNWRYLKERDDLKIQPFWRGVFGLFFIHSLLKAIRNDTAAGLIRPANFSSGGLATGWILLMFFGNMLGRSPEPGVNLIGIIISAPSFCFLLPVQNYINAVNEASPIRPSYSNWSVGHTVCLVLGIIMWLLILIGLTG